MKRDETVYLRHILDAVSAIAEYLQGVSEEDFKRNRLLQDGVIRQLQIIGEATKRLSGDFRAAHPHIPWQDIAGMRDKLTHDYLGVDTETVWLTVIEDLPTLESEIRVILDGM
jgi:uncharacterized protein with HEPN domain